MNRFNSKIVVVAVGMGLSLAAGTCEAADSRTHIRLGTFGSNWCGYNGKITLDKQLPNKFDGVVRTFQGTVLLEDTGQVDRITVQQLTDGRLHMVRTLSGKNAGRSEVMVTHPPELVKRNDGKLRVNFATRRVEGKGVKLLGFMHMTAK